MRVDVIDLLRREFRISQGIAHRPNTRFSARQRCGHVKRIVVQAITEQFRVNPRPARSGMIEFFDNKRGRAFAHHKSIARSVERTAGQRRIAGRAAHGFNQVECAERKHGERRLGSAGHDHVCKIVPNISQRFAHRHSPAGATVRIGRPNSAESKFNGDVRMR